MGKPQLEMEMRRKLRSAIIKLIKLSEESEERGVSESSRIQVVHDLEELAFLLRNLSSKSS